MDIKCPHCGTEYEIDKKDMYRYTKCEVCGKGFVAGATSSLLSSEEPPTSQSRVTTAHSPTTAQSQKRAAALPQRFARFEESVTASSVILGQNQRRIPERHKENASPTKKVLVGKRAVVCSVLAGVILLFVGILTAVFAFRDSADNDIVCADTNRAIIAAAVAKGNEAQHVNASAFEATNGVESKTTNNNAVVALGQANKVDKQPIAKSGGADIVATTNVAEQESNVKSPAVKELSPATEEDCKANDVAIVIAAGDTNVVVKSNINGLNKGATIVRQETNGAADGVEYAIIVKRLCRGERLTYSDWNERILEEFGVNKLYRDLDAELAKAGLWAVRVKSSGMMIRVGTLTDDRIGLITESFGDEDGFTYSGFIGEKEAGHIYYRFVKLEAEQKRLLEMAEPYNLAFKNSEFYTDSKQDDAESEIDVVKRLCKGERLTYKKWERRIREELGVNKLYDDFATELAKAELWAIRLESSGMTIKVGSLRDDREALITSKFGDEGGFTYSGFIENEEAGRIYNRFLELEAEHKRLLEVAEPYNLAFKNSEFYIDSEEEEKYEQKRREEYATQLFSPICLKLPRYLYVQKRLDMSIVSVSVTDWRWKALVAAQTNANWLGMINIMGSEDGDMRFKKFPTIGEIISIHRKMLSYKWNVEVRLRNKGVGSPASSSDFDKIKRQIGRYCGREEDAVGSEEYRRYRLFCSALSKMNSDSDPYSIDLNVRVFKVRNDGYIADIGYEKSFRGEFSAFRERSDTIPFKFSIGEGSLCLLAVDDEWFWRQRMSDPLRRKMMKYVNTLNEYHRKKSELGDDYYDKKQYTKDQFTNQLKVITDRYTKLLFSDISKFMGKNVTSSPEVEVRYLTPAELDEISTRAREKKRREKKRYDAERNRFEEYEKERLKKEQEEEKKKQEKAAQQNERSRVHRIGAPIIRHLKGSNPNIRQLKGPTRR